MNYHLKFTSAFKKAYKRSQKRGLNIQKLDAIIDELRQGNPLPAKYRDHALTGKMSCFRECHIQPDWLLVYRAVDRELRLARTGTHADLFDE